MTDPPAEPLTDPPPSLAAALAQLQTQLPPIAKNVDGQFGKYADLADVSRELLPIMGALGLSFTARPTIIRTPEGGREFVLAYRLRHVSGESDEGEYLLPTGTPQQLGSAITYARRYSLCAVTGAVADHDDDGRAASQQPPAARQRAARRGPPPERAPAALPRNADGSLARSQIMDTELAAAGVMTSEQQAEHTALRKGAATGRVPGTERLATTPDDDPWYDAPPPNGAVRAPVAAGNVASVIAMHFQRLGFTDRDERLKATAALAGRPQITSTNDLTAGEGKVVKSRLERCKDRAALVELLAVSADA